MKTSQFSSDPLEVPEIEKGVANMARLDPAVAAKLRDILGMKK
jgi:hypothetical protein